MKKNNFARGIGVLLQAFPDKKINCEVFWTFLNDLTDEEFLRGITKIISTKGDIYPSTNLIALIRGNAKISDKKTSGEAWAEVLQAVKDTGSYRKPEFSTPLIQKAVECVGWREICMSECIGVERAHFLKIYEELAEREKNTEMLSGNAVKELINISTKSIEHKKG